LIEVKHLTKRYGDHAAVRDLSFTIRPGRIYGFLGPNGAGKSTTMNMITGCLAMTEGEVIVNGHDIIAEPEAAKRYIGYLPEQPPLYMDMTPLEYLAFVAKAKGVDKGRIGEAVKNVMEETHITSVGDRLIRNLSKGFRQRVGIAQAMLGDPELIVLDEPTVGLDPKQIIEIRDLILELGKTRTVLLSSHILAEIQAVCDTVMILSHGRLVANGTLEEIRRAYAGDNTISLEVKGSEKEIQRILSGLKNTTESEMIETERGHYRVRIEVGGARDIREEVFFAFAAAKCPILSMQSGALTLEEIFLRLTAEEEKNEDATEEIDPLFTLPDDAEEAEADEENEENEENEEEGDDYVPLFGGRTDDEEEEED